jgi:hypothetical protein
MTRTHAGDTFRRHAIIERDTLSSPSDHALTGALDASRRGHSMGDYRCRLVPMSTYGAAYLWTSGLHFSIEADDNRVASDDQSDRPDLTEPCDVKVTLSPNDKMRVGPDDSACTAMRITMRTVAECWAYRNMC